MSVEPGVVDANILVYAVNPDVPQHAASYALLEAARDPAVTLYIDIAKCQSDEHLQRVMQQHKDPSRKESWGHTAAKG